MMSPSGSICWSWVRRKTGWKNPCKVANVPIEPRDLLTLEVKARVKQGTRVEPELKAKPEVRAVFGLRVIRMMKVRHAVKARHVTRLRGTARVSDG